MSWEVFPPLLSFGRVFEKLVSILTLIGRLQKPSGPGLYIVGSFLITNSVSSLFIDLSCLFLLEEVLVVCISLGICPFHLSNFVMQLFKVSFIILFISIRLVVMSPSLLILVIGVFSHFFSPVNITKSLSILLIF